MNKDDKVVLSESRKASNEIEGDGEVRASNIPDCEKMENEIRSLNLKLLQLSQGMGGGLKRVEKLEQFIDELQRNSQHKQTETLRPILEPIRSVFPQILDACQKLYQSEGRHEDSLKDPSHRNALDGKSAQEHIFHEDGDEAVDQTGLAPLFDGTLKELKAEMRTFNEQMGQLRLDFESKIKNDQTKEAIIDRLHKENQDYKRDLLRKVMEPILLNIIRLMDDYEKLSKYYHGKPLTPEDGQRLQKSVESISSDLEYLLLNQGAEPYSTEEGFFDPKRHRAVTTVETTDEAKDKALVETLRPGYRWGDRVIRYEMVSVNVYKKPQSDEDRRDENE